MAVQQHSQLAKGPKLQITQPLQFPGLQWGGVQTNPTRTKTKLPKPTKPCSACTNLTKESVLQIYRGLCRECKLKFYERTPAERKRFLDLATSSSSLKGFGMADEFFEVYFDDEEVFDEFLERGPHKDELRSILSTLAERFTDQLYCDGDDYERNVVNMNEDAKCILNALSSSLSKFKEGETTSRWRPIAAPTREDEFDKFE